ncbi:AAA family ATPase [Bacillus sp. FJAT-44742]|uniref:AAA family ATPase n=1 Tax=Bacillus sp. FJAT-44742 TaxID=2014005 RepID=UPI000C2419BD|nr:SMC family ATPase [Bacillus sp. FJAT-44742]
MRPIALTVQGLHSFREKQTVDFQYLCEGGVFGIFGPTGSGKSSLLDAMTLALYGKVERAPNNTQGILNHAEDSLAVSLTFTLGPRTYKAERSLKRTVDSRLRTATCRLLDLTEEPVVLADKANEVGKEIEALLGLSIEDFTRAVVLPQGKFAEFLSLKGTDRRHMLQRLFNLEKYGDELNNKIKSKAIQVKNEIEKIEAVQQSLGDASEDTVKEAEEKVNRLSEDLQMNKNLLENLETRQREEKEIMELQTKKAKAEGEIGNLTDKKDNIQELEKKCELSIQAEKLVPYAEEVQSWTESFKKWECEREKRIKEVKGASDHEKEATEIYEKAKASFKEKQPRLQSKHVELSQAKETEMKLQKEQESYERLQQESKYLFEEQSRAQQNYQKAKSDHKKYVDVQKSMKEELAELEPQQRAKKEIYQAYEASQKVLQLQSRASEEEEELKKRNKWLKEMEKRIEIQSANYKDAEDAGKQRFNQIFRWYERTAEEERSIDSFRKALQKEKASQQEEMEARRAEALAHQLVSQLKEGEPCPVCGSREHPSPSKETQYASADSKDTIEKLSSWEETAAQVKSEIGQRKWKLEQMSSQLTEGLSAEVAAATEEEESEGSEGFPSLGDSRWEEKASYKLTSLKQEGLTIEHLEYLVKDDMKRFTDITTKINQLEAEKKSEEKARDAAQKKVTELHGNADNEMQKWEELYPSLSFQSIKDEKKKLEKQEEQAAILRQRIEKSRPFIERKEEEIDQLENELNQCQLKEASLKEKLSGKTELIREMKGYISNLAGTKTIDALLQEVKATLTELEEKEESSLNALNKAKSLLHQAENEKAAAEQACKDAEQRLAEASAKWEQHRKKTNFTSKEEVRAAVLGQDKRTEYENYIQNFYEKEKQFLHLINEYTEQLDNRTVSEKQLEETEAKVRETKSLVDQLREQSGAAQEVFRDITEKHKRYKECQKEIEKLGETYSKYHKLEKIFKGKAFVEFIAEEQLEQVSKAASERLHVLTRGRYAIEVDSSGGFVIRDDSNGGVKRSVSTLSGGETFLTSLALALSLSASIQLRGEHPLEFFFLDEGFGTLDQELLETVISALEKLQADKLSVGVISHVPELKERLPRKLTVTPAESGGKGSTVSLESM